jgi:hypothetical protein
VTPQSADVTPQSELPGNLSRITVQEGRVIKRPTAFLVPLALFALVSFGAACDVMFQGMNAQATDQWQRTYKLPEGGQFQLNSPNGAIEVAPSADATTVEVVAERRARASSEEAAKEELKRIQITDRVTPTSIRIEVARSSDSGLHMGRGGREVFFKIKVPKNAAVTLETRNGEVHVTGLSGSVKADSSNGSIVGEELSGPVQAGTTNGDVRMQVVAVQPDGIRLDTTNGSIDLKIPADAKADISARWVNGNFRTSGINPEGQRERRRFEGKLNGGGPRIELSTTNGSIHISG